MSRQKNGKNGKVLKSLPWRLDMPDSRSQKYNTLYRRIERFMEKRPRDEELEHFLKKLGVLSCVLFTVFSTFNSFIYYMMLH